MSTTMRQRAQEYLALRRAMGFKLERPGSLVLQFADHLDRQGTTSITVDAAVTWARQPAQASPMWWGYRLSAVRGFATYLHPRMSGIEVPPADLLPLRSQRATPYLYSTQEMQALWSAARNLRSPLLATTYETMIALIAVTGLRLGETLDLLRTDVDLASGTLLIRRGKDGKSRQVPLHPSAVAALGEHAHDRDRLVKHAAANFFLSTAGTRLSESRVESTFRSLVRAAGLRPRSPRCRPRIHDLRHTFAVNTVLDWYRQGQDVQPKMPLLSTYLGHVDPNATYWYLSTAPELMAAASARLERQEQPT